MQTNFVQIYHIQVYSAFTKTQITITKTTTFKKFQSNGEKKFTEGHIMFRASNLF